MSVAHTDGTGSEQTSDLDRSLMDGVLREHPVDPLRADAYLGVTTVQAHAANLATLLDGDLGLVWFGGTQEGVGDISIQFARLAVGSDRWSEPEQLTDDASRSEQNPILFPAPDGTLWLLFTAQLAGNQDTAEVRRRVSPDSGRTWGPVETLFPADAESGVFVRQPPLVTSTGRWLLGVFRCVTVPGERWAGEADTSSVMVSDDAGATWREVPVPGSVGCVHMGVSEVEPGLLVALFRSRWADHVYRSESHDDGETWSVPEPTSLPNNNSSIQQTLLADGRLALVLNDSSRLDATERRVSLYDEIDDEGLAAEEGPRSADLADEAGTRRAFWGAPRAPLTLAVSADAGHTWQRLAALDEGDGYCLTNNSRDRLNRELSYPSVHQAPDGTLHVAYTYHRQTIKHVRLAPGWVSP